MTFEEQLLQQLQKSVLENLKNAEFIKVDYSDRKPLPKELLVKLWASVDWNAVLTQLKPELERRIGNAIIGNMDIEIKNDVKALMSIAGVRERLRLEVYPKIMRIIDET